MDRKVSTWLKRKGMSGKSYLIDRNASKSWGCQDEGGIQYNKKCVKNVFGKEAGKGTGKKKEFDANQW